MEKHANIKERWLAAMAYAAILVVIPVMVPVKSDFLARHCRQGLALFFVELVGFLLILIIDGTIGRIPILGFLVAVLLRLALFLVFLVASALGFAKALFGEEWRIPFLDEWAEQIPVR